MVAKVQTIYSCSNCDAQSPKWLGRCAECGQWGTLEKQQVVKKRKGSETVGVPAGQVQSLADISDEQLQRLPSTMPEFDRVLGGGIVPGGLILLGGDPGIGKSTLILQIGGQLAAYGRSVLYISGEESGSQVKGRCERLGLTSPQLKFLGETDIDVIASTVREHRPDFVVLDSIQTMHSAEVDADPGSVGQVRTVTGQLVALAKELNVPIVVIGHVTKEGAVAGPRSLEHLVDVVLYLEGDQHHAFRILRAVKNRFGSTNEVGVFDMRPEGMVEVQNPSEIFLSERKSSQPGSVVTVVVEGSRAFMVEVQALVTRSNFGYPQRRSVGFSLNRLQVLIAVLMKKAGLFLGNQDVHVNVAGGFRVNEPAVDLAVCLAIASAMKNKPLAADMVVFGEVGLGGELRSVSHVEKRLEEIMKMGFTQLIMPQMKLLDRPKGLNIIHGDGIGDILRESV